MGEPRCLGKRIVVATVIATTVTSLCMASPGKAQATHLTMAYAPSESIQAPANPLQKKITVGLSNVPLEEALSELTRRSGVALMYSRDALPMRKAVSVQGTKIDLGAAIAQALRGTGFSAQLTPEGRVVLSKEATRPAAEGTITGRVIDAKTKRPIARASVTIGDASTGVVTGADGRFQISAASGEQTVRVRALGYTSSVQSVTVTEDGQVSVEIALEPTASVLNEVVVTGTVVATERRALSNPITVITAEEIERRGVTRIEEFLRGEVPGVLALEQGSKVYSSGPAGLNSVASALGSMQSSAIYSRGASQLPGEYHTTPLKTFVDGVELLDASYLGTIDPRTIERIEIITGPQAATIYGSGAMGGVMQIFTKKGSGAGGVELTANLKYGALQSSMSNAFTPSHNHSLLLSASDGPRLSYSATLSYNYTGQWQPDLYSRRFGASIGATHTRGAFRTSMSINATLANNGTTQGCPTCVWSSPLYRELLQTGEWKVGRFAIGSSNRVQRNTNVMFSLNLDYQARPWWQHHMTVGRSNSEFSLDALQPLLNTPEDTLFDAAVSSGHRLTASYTTTLQPAPVGVLATTLSLGVTGSAGDQTRTFGCLATESSTSFINCGTSFLSTVSVTKPVDDRSWGAFGNWRIGLFDQLCLTLGLRAETNPSYGTDHKVDWTPTNGLAYNISVGDLTVKLMGSYGRATRAPAADRRLEQTETSTILLPSIYVSQLANPDLRPEYSSGPQGGIEIYYGNRATLTVNRYRQTVTDLIQRVEVDSIDGAYVSDGRQYWISQYQWRNTAKVRQHGWEATGSLNVGAFSVKSTYSWNDSRILEVHPSFLGNSYYAPGRSFSQLPTHTGHISLSYARGATSVTLSTNFVGESLQGGSSHRYLYLERMNMRITSYIHNDKASNFEYAKPGYAKSDLAIAHRISPSLSLTGNITNIGNSFGSEVEYMFPVLGRQTLLGVSWRILD